MKDKPIERRKEAVALSYNDREADAPIVVAKGKGYIADSIIEEARKHQVPIQEDPSLVELLSNLNINDKIPEELYQVVAEVFAFIYRTEQEASKQMR